MISIQRSFGIEAPRTLVVSRVHGGSATNFGSCPQIDRIERGDAEAEPDRDEHLLDVASVERSDQHELDEARRTSVPTDEPDQRRRG